MNLNAILQGMQDFRAYSIVELVPSVITLILLLILILLPYSAASVVGAVAAYVIGNMAGVVAVVWMLKKRLDPSESLLSFRIVPSYLRQMLHYGLKSQLNIISIYLLLRVDVLLLNIVGGGPASVGIYSIAVLFADRVWLVSGFTSRLILPRIAASEGADKNRTFLSLMTTRYTFWFSVLIAIVLSLLGEWIIRLIYGDEFQPATLALLAILPGVVLFNFGVVLSSDISGRGRPAITAVHAGIAFIINLIANLLLIPRFDYVGAALASTLAYGYYGVVHVYVFTRLTGSHWWEVLLPTQDDLMYAGKLLSLIKNRLF